MYYLYCGFLHFEVCISRTIITNNNRPNSLKFGEFLQSWIGYLHTAQMLSSILTYYLFICACRGSFKLKWYEFLYILGATVICKLVNTYIPEFYVHTSTCCMLFLGYLCKGKLLYVVTSFTIHGYLSQLLFKIRGFETVITQINYASALVLSIEGWVWLVLLGLVFYLKEKKNGRMVTTISQQNG